MKRIANRNPYQVSVSIVRDSGFGAWRQGKCYGCGKDIIGEPKYSYTYVQQRGQHREISVFSCCQSCAFAQDAIDEAEAEGRRFTKITVGFAPDHDGGRCICGGVILDSLSSCIKCSVAYRMLSRAQFNQRLLASALRELKSEIKEQKKKQEEPNRKDD